MSDFDAFHVMMLSGVVGVIILLAYIWFGTGD